MWLTVEITDNEKKIDENEKFKKKLIEKKYKFLYLTFLNKTKGPNLYLKKIFL